MKKHVIHFLITVCSFCFAPLIMAQAVYIDLSNETHIAITNQIDDDSHVIVIEDRYSPDNETPVTSKKQSLPFHQAVVSASNATNLDPALIHAVITVESRHNPKALSPKGAFGLMQLMPETAARFNASNKADYAQNVMAGAQYLSELLTMFDQDLSLALAAYNAGPAAVKKYNNKIPPYAETAQYVPKVLRYYQQYLH